MSSQLVSWLRNRFGTLIGRRNPWDDRNERINQEFRLLIDHGSRGDRAAAIQQCGVIASLLDSWKIEDLDSASDEALEFFGKSHLSISQVLRESDQAQASIDHAQRAREFWNRLANRNPDDSEAWSSLATTYNYEGMALVDLDEYETAIRVYDKVIETRRTIRAQHPENDLNVVFLGGAYCNRGIAEKHSHDPDAAMRDYETAIDILSDSIPGCDCGCRVAIEAEIAAMTRKESPMFTGLNFLRNTLNARANLLGPDAALKHIGQMIMRMSPPVVKEEFDFLYVRFVDESISDDPQGNLNELRLELIQTLFTSSHFVVLDFSAVKSMDGDAVKLLRHLRSQMIASNRWIGVVGLTPELIESTPEMKWEVDFDCFETLEHFLDACRQDRGDDEPNSGDEAE